VVNRDPHPRDRRACLPISTSYNENIGSKEKIYRIFIQYNDVKYKIFLIFVKYFKEILKT